MSDGAVATLEINREHLAAARTALRGTDTDHGIRELERRIAFAERQGWLCTWCEFPMSAADIGAGRTHVDHVIPRARGGPNAEWNKELLHARCNIGKKKRMTAKAWRLADERGISVLPPEPTLLSDVLRSLTGSLRRVEVTLADFRAAGVSVNEDVPELLGRVREMTDRVASFVSLAGVLSNTPERE